MTPFPKPEPRRRQKLREDRAYLVERSQVRRTVIARDQCRCRVCGAWVSYEGAHVHEVVFRSHAGTRDVALDPANCVTLCPACHARVHRHELVLALTPDLVVSHVDVH